MTFPIPNPKMKKMVRTSHMGVSICRVLIPASEIATAPSPIDITALYPNLFTMAAERGAAIICPTAKGRKHNPAVRVSNPRSICR